MAFDLEKRLGLSSFSALEKSAYSFSLLRTLLYSAEGLMLPALAAAVERKRPRWPQEDPKTFAKVRAALEDLLKRDSQNIAEGLYPLDVLKPENPWRHVRRLSPMFREGLRAAWRRKGKKAHEFSEEATELLTDVPEYYRRNFHFQGDGYLSKESAELYDHQVQILFAGAADAMRRLIIPPMKSRFENSNGEGLTFLEIGAGTGRATKSMRLAFPKAKIVLLDLSAPYLKKAQETLKDYARHDFIEGDGAKLPFLPQTFDAVYSVFLFHELPMAERKAVVRESLRVLKPGGFLGFVDSLQLGDTPEFDPSLKQFPQDFHEPFYRDYISHPMEEVFAGEGAEDVVSGTGFFSKVVSARKA